MDDTQILPGLVIVPESGIPAPSIKRRKPDVDAYREAISKMAVGDSFFIEGRKLHDTMFLIKIAEEIGIKLTARNRRQDEVYQVEGVRFWRVEPDEVVELKLQAGFGKVADKMKGVRYWHDKKFGSVFAQEAVPSGDVEEITSEKYELLKKAYETDEL